MRELGFSQLWPKLAKPTFTTFRFTRRDTDWRVGETVKVVFKPRSKDNRSVLGLAGIVDKMPRQMAWYGSLYEGTWVSHDEAKTDGFDAETNRFGGCKASYFVMWEWLWPIYGARLVKEPMNKLTLTWLQYWLYVPEQKPHIAKEWAALLKAEGVATNGKLTRFIMPKSILERLQIEATVLGKLD